MKAINLRTEYLKDPMGIDINDPRLLWNCEGGKKQTAYRIAARTEDNKDTSVDEKSKSPKTASVSFSVREVQKTPILYKVAFRTERVGFLSPLLQGDRKRKGVLPVILQASPPTGGTGLRAPPSLPF